MHLLHAEPRGEAAVAATLAEAGRRALASAAAVEAAACIARALAEPPPAGDRAALLLDLARAEHGPGGPRRSTTCSRRRTDRRPGPPRPRGARAGVGERSRAPGPGGGARDDRHAIAGVAGRDRELELRLEAVRYMAIFLSSALMREALGEPERFAALEGRTAGEGELLLHVAVHRFLLGRSADAVAEPLERAVADPAVVAAIGPDSAWLDFVLGGLFKADRLDVARRTASIAYADAQRRGSAPGFAAASAWRAWIALREGVGRRRGGRRPRGVRAPAGRDVAAPLVGGVPDRGARGARRARRGAGGARGGRRRGSDSGRPRPSCCCRRARRPRRAGRPRGALADQLESRRRRGDGFQADPDFDGWLRIARLLHVIGDRGRRARRPTPRSGGRARGGRPAPSARPWRSPGSIRGGDAGSRSCATRSSSSSARPRGASSRARWSSWAARCAGRGERRRRASRCGVRSRSPPPAALSRPRSGRGTSCA